MKVLVLTTCYPRRKSPNHGIFIHRQVRALADLGVDCQVLQPVGWAPPAPFYRLHPGWVQGKTERDDMLSKVDGISVHHPRVPHPLPSRFFPGDYWERVGKAVGHYICRHPKLADADLVYAQFLCHEGFAGVIAGRMTGIPVAAIARGDDVHAWPRRWPDRITKLHAVFSEAASILANSEGLARDAATWAPNGWDQEITVVYNGVDTNVFTPSLTTEQKHLARLRWNLPASARLLLCVAFTSVAKGWIELLDAFKRLEHFADAHLVMAGVSHGNDALDLIHEADQRGLKDRVHWLGCVCPEAMPDLYRACDIFVLPSHNEGLSNSMLEAMATGVPVIVTRVGGHCEIVKNGVHGKLIPPKDVNALKDAMEFLLVHREAVDAMGLAARKRAQQIGDPRTNAVKLLKHFETLLKSRAAEHLFPV